MMKKKEYIAGGKEQMIHYLKIKPEFFEAVQGGIKNFELRKNDRNYKVDDWIVLQEWDGTKYTGRSVLRHIVYTLDPAAIMKCEPGYLLLGLKTPQDGDWIPVSERLPETIPLTSRGVCTYYSETVLVITANRCVLTAVWSGAEWIAPFDFWDIWDSEMVTHWMPLPSLPAEYRDGGGSCE